MCGAGAGATSSLRVEPELAGGLTVKSGHFEGLEMKVFFVESIIRCCRLLMDGFSRRLRERMGGGRGLGGGF
jgi:hypothetical protein